LRGGFASKVRFMNILFRGTLLCCVLAAGCNSAPDDAAPHSSASDESAVDGDDAAASSEADPAVDASASTHEPPAWPGPKKVEEHYAGLENVMRVSDRIYSGSEPHGAEAFQSLRKLGVKTIVSVDGARPNVEAARAAGIRYVHIPIGYGGVSAEAGAAFARLVQDAESPFYIHCHHGKHRGPAAAAVACIADGDVNGQAALAILETAGTSSGYAGLWRDVEAYTPPAQGTDLPELVEIAQVESLAAAMAQVDRAFDNLKLCKDAGWKTPPDHPDVVPAQEALLLKESFREAARNLSPDYDEQFKTWLLEAETLATSLEGALRNDAGEDATRFLGEAEQSCQQCHENYRN
jgi:protein tyrosine phosphatase (PTP) superfamily phosphohydrolase (DUF442 family)